MSFCQPTTGSRANILLYNPSLTSVGDGNNANPVVLSAGSAQLNVVCGMDHTKLSL